MTESNNNILEDGPRTSDVWTYYGRYLSDQSDEEQLAEWGQAVWLLRDLGRIGETLASDALVVALADAQERAKEELARVEERLSRPEGEKLHPRERERLTAMMNRCDALSNAYCVVEAASIENADLKANTLKVLKAMRGEANEQLSRYRIECGIPDGL